MRPAKPGGGMPGGWLIRFGPMGGEGRHRTLDGGRRQVGDDLLDERCGLGLPLGVGVGER
jgi:hypothetical protein